MKKEKMGIYDIFYLFIYGCFFGWVVEVIWSYFKRHMFINHSALVLGPFNVVYGLGSVVLSSLLKNYKEKDYCGMFMASFIIGTIIEYITSFLMEYSYGFIPWNYSKKFININGRICLIYSIFWGVLGIFWIKCVYPFFKMLIDKTNKEFGRKMMRVLIVFLIFDYALTVFCVYRAKEYEKGIPPQNVVERFVDKHFGVKYLNNMYNNRWNRK